MILEVHDLRKTYLQGAASIEVLRGAELRMERGDTVAIVGQSGSGKSTLLSLLAGLDAPSAGKVTLAGQDLAALGEEKLAEFRARNLSVIFQQFHLMSSLTALENVSLPLEIGGDPKALEKSREALRRVGLEKRARHFPRQLSGGERQRVAIARALVVEPKLLLADEPSGNLDTQTGVEVMQLLFDLVATHQTSLILVTHNPELARLCQRCLRLEDGILKG